MKLHATAVFVSTLVLLHTVTAVPRMRYLRSTLDSLSNYRIRDTIPQHEKNSDIGNASPPTDVADAENAASPMNTLLQKPMGALQGYLRPAKPVRGNPSAPEAVSTTMNHNPSRMPEDNEIPNDLKTEMPTGIDSPLREDTPQSLAEPDRDAQDGAISATASDRLKQAFNLNSILANIARMPGTVALQIDSVIAGLQKTYPPNTNVGAYIMATRFFLRNRLALRPFDLVDRAGLGRFEQLVSSMPSVFEPLFSAMDPLVNAMDRWGVMVAKRGEAAWDRLGNVARQITERASSTLAGINVTRNADSYAVSVPNMIDMVLKGRLAAVIDELFAYVQRIIGATLASLTPGIGSLPSNPIRNPGFSSM